MCRESEIKPERVTFCVNENGQVSSDIPRESDFPDSLWGTLLKHPRTKFLEFHGRERHFSP